MQAVFQVFSPPLLAKNQRLGVKAVSQPARWRTVLKYVPEMSTAAGAANLRADHAVAPILNLGDIFPREGLEKAGPSRAGVELCLRIEERQITPGAEINASLLVIQQGAAEWPLRPLCAEDLKAFRPELLQPLIVRLAYAGHLGGRKRDIAGAEQANRYLGWQIGGGSILHGCAQ